MPLIGPLKAALAASEAKTGSVCPGLPASDSALNKALHLLCGEAKVPAGGWHRFRQKSPSHQPRARPHCHPCRRTQSRSNGHPR